MAIVNMAPAVIPVLRERYPPIEWDLVTVPWNAGKTRGTWLSAEGFSLSSGTKPGRRLGGAEADLRARVPDRLLRPRGLQRPRHPRRGRGPFISAVPGKQVKTFVESIEFATLWGGTRDPQDRRPGGRGLDRGAGRARRRSATAGRSHRRLNDLLKETSA